MTKQVELRRRRKGRRTGVISRIMKAWNLVSVLDSEAGREAGSSFPSATHLVDKDQRNRSYE